MPNCHDPFWCCFAHLQHVAAPDFRYGLPDFFKPRPVYPDIRCMDLERLSTSPVLVLKQCRHLSGILYEFHAYATAADFIY